MARTRTPGIRADRNGGLIIDKEHRGIPIYVRLGAASQEEAEERLAAEIDRVDELLRGTRITVLLSPTAQHAISPTHRRTAPSKPPPGTSGC